MGLGKIFDPGRSIFSGSGWAGSAMYGLVWIWKVSPKNVKFFKFFLFRSKKISSGQVKKYPSQRQVCLLFTAGQNYAWVRSG